MWHFCPTNKNKRSPPMPKPIWTDFPDTIAAKQITKLLAEGLHLEAIGVAFRAGYDTVRPPDKALMRIALLRAERNWQTLNDEHTRLGLHLAGEVEQKALNKWLALRRWASEPSVWETREADQAQAAEAARAAEVELRAQQILAEENRAALERARERARNEITHD